MPIQSIFIFKTIMRHRLRARGATLKVGEKGGGGGGGLNSDSKWGAENIWAEAPPPPLVPLLRGPWTSKAIYVSCLFQTTLDSMRFHQKSSTISVVYGPMFIAPYIASHKISTGLLKQPLPYDNGTFSSYTYKNSLLCLL